MSAKLSFDGKPSLSMACRFFYNCYDAIGRGLTKFYESEFFPAHLSMSVKFQENVPLKRYTTFKIGGPARYFFIAKTKNQLVEAVQTAKKLNLALFILGSGSNLLVSDKGFNGLVIKFQVSGFRFQGIKIFVDAGLALSKLVIEAANAGLSGLEWAAGIPGSVGGAVFGNAGAFGKSMGDAITFVEIFDVKKNRVRKLTNKECRFGYRQSIFKAKRDFIILSCELKLKKRDKSDIKKEMKGYLDYREVFHPKTPSAGSVFMNPKGYAARELIDICGLKGKKIGGAQISNHHSNFIVNLGDATAQNVLDLIGLVKKAVKKKFKVELKEEIIFLE